MFLSVGLRLVAMTSAGLGGINIILLLVYLLTMQHENVAQLTKMNDARLAANLGIVLVGVGLYRMSAIAWVSFWFMGLLSLPLAGQQCHQLLVEHGQVDPIPMWVLVGLALWYVPSGICLLLPSSRKYFFDEPGSIRMHKEAVRAVAERASWGVSGRPKLPVGIPILSTIAITIATCLFVYALYEMEPDVDPLNPKEPMPIPTVISLLCFSVAVVWASVGLYKRKLWGWVATVSFAVLAVLVVGFLLATGKDDSPSPGAAFKHPYFLLSLLWCGTAILYLMRTEVRHAYFSRRRSRRHSQGGG